MIRSILIITLMSFFICTTLYAGKINYSIGIYGGGISSLGGDLNSSVQREYFNSDNGIDGMTRSITGYSASNINRLFGICGGIEFKAILYEFYLVRIAGNYFQSIIGGNGDTVFSRDSTNYYLLKCTYSLLGFDVPLTFGLIIPFWKDVKISMSCGIAYASAEYKNSFESSTYSDPFERRASFKNWALPLVTLLEGEYFVSSKLAFNSIISYYHGSTEALSDSKRDDLWGLGYEGTVDFARIDFTGYRFTIGISYYFYSI